MNWGNALMGAGTGAAMGAATGSAFGPGIGTGIGAGIGALGGGLAGLFGSEGTPSTNEQVQQYTPEQQTALKYLLQSGLGGMQQMGQPSFAPYEQAARQNFATKTIPSIAERFTAMGGGQYSSNYPGALGEAGSSLESNLSLMKQQWDQQQRGNLMQMLQAGLTPQVENYYNKKQPSMFESVLPGMIGSLPSIAMMSQFKQQPQSGGKPQSYADLTNPLAGITRESLYSGNYTGGRPGGGTDMYSYLTNPLAGIQPGQLYSGDYTGTNNTGQLGKTPVGVA
jgi:hypothetical protein